MVILGELTLGIKTFFLGYFLSLCVVNVNAQDHDWVPKGRYIASFSSEERSEIGLLPLDFTDEGLLLSFGVEDDDEFPFAHWKQEKANEIYLDFTANLFPAMHSLTGNYIVEYKTHLVYALVGETETVFLQPYKPQQDSSNMEAYGLQGKWQTTLEDGTVLSYEFLPPNIVEVVNKFSDNSTLSDECFFTITEAESLIMYPVFLVENMGELEQINVSGKTLSFVFKGKSMLMQKQ